MNPDISNLDRHGGCSAAFHHGDDAERHETFARKDKKISRKQKNATSHFRGSPVCIFSFGPLTLVPPPVCDSPWRRPHQGRLVGALRGAVEEDVVLHQHGHGSQDEGEEEVEVDVIPGAVELPADMKNHAGGWE